MMQVFLTQARGPVRNGDLLVGAVDFALSIQRQREGGTAMGDMDKTLLRTLSAVAEALDAEGVAYAITGSIASSVHGEPFSSIDVDLILHASPTQAENVAMRLAPRFYAPPEMLADAAGRKSIANVVDNATSLKADLSFVPSTGFLGLVMRRRVQAAIGSQSPQYWFTTPEDVILMKLLLRKDTQSAKQWENALGVARVKGVGMDWKYLFEQAEGLGVKADLVRLRDEAGI
jgi:hypothetical protein